MKTLHINVVDKIATYYKRDGDIVCGNSDYQLKFTFDSEWDAHNSKTARIIINGEYKDVPFLGNVCTLPIIKNATQIEVGVYAGELNTTTRAIIGCKPSILCGSSVPASDEEMDKEYASAAKEAAQTAIGAAETAVGAVGKAEIAADRAEDALERAEEAAERAEAAGDEGNEAVIGVLESDTAVSSVKPVPETSAPYAEVVEIGGMTRKCTNIWDEQYEVGGYADTTGDRTSQTDRIRSANYIEVHPSTIYYLKTTKSYARIFFADTNKTFLSAVSLESGSFTTPVNCRYIKFYWVSPTYTSGDIMVNKGTEPLPYEPYFEGLRSAKVESVESVGENLLPFPYTSGGSGKVVESSGGKVEVLSGGGLSLSGMPTGYIGFRLYQGKLLYKGKQTLMLSGDYTNYYATVFLYTDETYNTEITQIAVSSSGLTFDTNDYPSATYMIVETARNSSGNAMTGVVYPMLNKGTTALPYTPYVKRTLPIPEAVRPKHGINENVYDSIRRDKDGKWRKRVKCGVVDLGTLEWGLEERPTPIPHRFNAVLYDAPQSYDINLNVLCSKYTAADAPIGTGDIDMAMALYGGRVYILDGTTEYTDAATFKAAMSGVMLVYELAEPEVTDISDLLPDNLIGVEDGGTLTFNNEFGYDVPNTVNFYTYNNELMCADTFVGDLKGTANRAIYDSKGRDIAEKLDELANGSGGGGGEGSPGVGIESVEQTVTSNADGGTNEITVTLTDGSKSKFNVKNGSQGSPGTPGGKGGKGDPGVGIESVEQTTTSTVDGGTNVITVKLTDGKTSTFTVKNGSTGSGGSGGGGSGENTAAAEAAAARAEAAATRAETAETNTEQAASDISGAAERAESAATAAESAENRIYETETEINQTAETVRSRAEAAEEAKGFAEGYRDEAKGYSDTAQGYAGDAADEVGKAKEHADTASDNKDLALKYATAAEISKNLAETAKAEAQQAASDISGAAERAEDAATAADGYANQANGYADEAKGHAETARSRAEAAEEAKGFAQGYRDEAKGYSDTAQGYAGDAADEVGKAKEHADAAKTSETNAKTSETNAANSAAEAKNAASDLSGAAERAEASEAAAEGFVNQAYGYADEASTAARIAAAYLQTMRDMAEIWTFTFADGTVVTKKVCIVD